MKVSIRYVPYTETIKGAVIFLVVNSLVKQLDPYDYSLKHFLLELLVPLWIIQLLIIPFAIVINWQEKKGGR